MDCGEVDCGSRVARQMLQMYIRLHHAARDFPTCPSSVQGFSASQQASHVTCGYCPWRLLLFQIVALQLDVVAGATNGEWLERDPGMHLIASSSSIATFASQSASSPLPTTTSSAALDHPGSGAHLLGSAPSRANANIEPSRRQPRLPGPLIN